MSNLRPHSVLIKPRPGKESDCKIEALRFLKSWSRARKRLAIRARPNDETTKTAQPKPKRSQSAAAG